MKMNTLLQWFKNPRQRRQALTISRRRSDPDQPGGPLCGRADWAGGRTAGGCCAGGRVGYHHAALQNLRNRAFSIELLVSIAFIGALTIGEFWEAAAVAFLFIFGAYLEAHTLSQTRKVLGELFDMAPTTALVLPVGSRWKWPRMKSAWMRPF